MTEIDLILNHLANGKKTPLPPELQAHYERLCACDDLIRQHGSRRKVVHILRQKYNISQAQAYQDYQDAISVFGSTTATEKAYWLDITFGFIMETRRKAFAAKDWKAVAICEANMVKALKEVKEVKAEPFLPHTNVIGFFPDLMPTLEITAEELEEEIKKLEIPKAEYFRKNGKQKDTL